MKQSKARAQGHAAKLVDDSTERGRLGLPVANDPLLSLARTLGNRAFTRLHANHAGVATSPAPRPRPEFIAKAKESVTRSPSAEPQLGPEQSEMEDAARATADDLAPVADRGPPSDGHGDADERPPAARGWTWP